VGKDTGDGMLKKNYNALNQITKFVAC
jgi:hypothetical protein